MAIWVLSEGPKTEKDLIIRTGRHQTTVNKWLSIMAGLHDGISDKPMIYQKAGLCYRNNHIDLNKIAELLEVDGIMNERRLMHQQERRRHNAFFRKQ